MPRTYFPKPSQNRGPALGDGGEALDSTAARTKMLAQLEQLLSAAMKKYIQLAGRSAAFSAQTLPGVIPGRSDSLLEALALSHAVRISLDPFVCRFRSKSVSAFELWDDGLKVLTLIMIFCSRQRAP